MADKPVVLFVLELSVLEKQYVRRGLEVLRASLVRSKAKELEGSAVLKMRDDEIAYINNVLGRF